MDNVVFKNMIEEVGVDNLELTREALMEAVCALDDILVMNAKVDLGAKINEGKAIEAFVKLSVIMNEMIDSVIEESLEG